MDGFLDLTNLETKSDDDILNANVNESGDVLNNENTNVNESGDVNISVPGGLSEKPSGVPSDVSIPVPATTTLTDKEYKDALNALQKSFKEGYEIMQMLSEATVVHETIEDQQNEFTENAIAQAILESYENGPIFEAVERSDKKNVKEIVKKMRKSLKESCKEDGIYYRDASALASIIACSVAGGVYGGVYGAVAGGVAGAVTGAVAGGVTGAVASSLAFWKVRLWQVVGVLCIEGGNVKTVFDNLNEKFKEDLGDYKLLYCPASPALKDKIAMKFGWKNVKKCYITLIEKKLPSEIKQMMKEIDSAIKENEKDESGEGEKEK